MKNKNNILSFPNSISKLERKVEAILFSASEPLEVETIEKRIQINSGVIKILNKLKDNYKNRGINLVCIKGKWSFRTAEDLSKLMALQKSTQKKLSKATVETLAIIVYHQPVTRSEIEEIRGVSFGTNTLEILLELDWVRPTGRKDVPGKPIQYATTENFLKNKHSMKKRIFTKTSKMRLRKLPKQTNKDIYLIKIIVYNYSLWELVFGK